MKKDKLKIKGTHQEKNPRNQSARSSAFNEQSTRDKKSTRNVEEEAVKRSSESGVPGSASGRL